MFYMILRFKVQGTGSQSRRQCVVIHLRGGYRSRGLHSDTCCFSFMLL